MNRKVNDMGQSYIAEPASFAGEFSWQGEILRKNIREVQPDYDLYDPRTWPLITTLHAIDVQPTTTQSIPPIGVAYGDRNMEELGTLMEMSTRADTVAYVQRRMINWRFRYYPFNFTKEGKTRERIGIPKADFEYWMEFVHGEEWRTQYKVSATVKTVKHIQNGRPVTTYERIMSTIAEQNTTSSTITALEEQLAQAKEQCQREEDRADKAEETIIDLEIQRDDEYARAQRAEEQATLAEQEHEAEMSDLETRADAAEEKVKELEEELEQTKDELEKAQKEAKEANERIEMIWQEMAKGKRKAGDEGAGGQGKKVKV